MKKMTCKQLGGACDKIFEAATFDEIAELSKQHGQEMYKYGDKAHLKAMQSMRTLMQTPDAMRTWFADKKKEFDALSEEA